MKLEFDGNTLHVYREPGDPAYYGVRNAAGESKLLYAIKKKLSTMGYDLIKTRMGKDGHMVPEMQQYLRARRPNKTDPSKDIAIHNHRWAIEGAEVDYNAGHVVLTVERNIFKLG
jgi:hypothetical protein